MTALALASTLTACGGDDEPQAEPTPTQSASALTSTASAAPSTSPSAVTTSGPTWDDKFSPAQLKRYRAARDHWLEYWAFYTDIAGKGVDTPRVLRGCEKYTMYPLSERSQFLDTYVRGGVLMEVPPEVLWTSATKITSRLVVLNYCLDHTDGRITTDGRLNKIDTRAAGWSNFGWRNLAGMEGGDTYEQGGDPMHSHSALTGAGPRSADGDSTARMAAQGR